MSLAIALSTIQVTERFNSVSPNFEREYPGGGQGPSTSLLLPPTPRENLQRDGYLKYLPAAKTLYIYKHSCLLRDSITGPTAQLPASLTIVPDGQRLSSRQRGTSNSRRAATYLVRSGEGVERWEAPYHSQGVLPQNWCETEHNSTVTCMVLKAKANDRRTNIVLSRDEFRKP
ncbi:hypothetical protein TNCV_1486501 [Trichonephila clavipes]|nr:hypothetical protein TNCV_1486501 [Trichonephila clavipes]